MTPPKITLDSVALAKLRGLNQVSELCDEAGRTLGMVVPTSFYQELMQTWSDATFDEELARKADEDYRAGHYKSTSEVLELLNRVEKAIQE